MGSSREFTDAVGRAVGILSSTFRVEADEMLLEAFTIGLEGCDPSQIAAAVGAVLRSNVDYMPTPGKLRELAVSSGSGFEAIAAAAWECLNRGITAVGSSGSPNFTDGLINATVRHLGGWERVCGMTDEEFEKWYRKDFERIYLQFLRNGVAADQCGYLVGSIERENARWHGQQIPANGKVYQLPDPISVDAPYKPQVLALPAPKRTAVELPRIEFRPIEVEPTAEPPRKSRIIKKGQ
jgi:hypothetical protein